MDLTRYSDKAFLISGHTYQNKGDIKSLGATWNKPLGGWIFSTKQLPDFVEFVRKRIPESNWYKLTSDDLAILRHQKDTPSSKNESTSSDTKSTSSDSKDNFEELDKQIEHLETVLKYLRSLRTAKQKILLTSEPVSTSAPVPASSAEDSCSESEEELMKRTGPLKVLFTNNT